jgi:hypothetical protein
VEGGASGFGYGTIEGYRTGGISGAILGGLEGAAYGAAIGGLTAGALHVGSRASDWTLDAVIETLDTFAPRLNPLNYRVPRGMFAGVPLPEYVAPQGGTYLLRARSGAVVRTGRTGNLIRRGQQHERLYEGTLHFEPAVRTNSYAVQRGSEQVLHDLYQPILNKISPIRVNHPLRDYYLNSYRQFLEALQ